MAVFRCENCNYEKNTGDKHIGTKVRCPKCKRVGVYSEKFSQCSACRYGYPLVKEVERFQAGVEESRREADPPRVPLVGVEAPSAAAGAFIGERPERRGVVRENVELVAGEPCPTCGKVLGRRTVKKERRRE